MKKRIVVQRLDLSDTALPLDHKIENLCEVNFAAGYELAAAFVQGSNLILIFKLL